MLGPSSHSARVTAGCWWSGDESDLYMSDEEEVRAKGFVTASHPSFGEFPCSALMPLCVGKTKKDKRHKKKKKEKKGKKKKTKLAERFNDNMQTTHMAHLKSSIVDGDSTPNHSPVCPCPCPATKTPSCSTSRPRQNKITSTAAPCPSKGSGWSGGIGKGALAP